MPTCYPGIVNMPALQTDPTASKWADVDLEGGSVEWNEGKARLDRELFGDTPRTWAAFVKADLEKIKRPAERVFSHALVGIACSGANTMVSAKTPFVQGKAMLGRLFRRKRPDPRVAPWGQGPRPGIWQFARQFIDELLPDFRAEAMNFEDWVQSMEPRRRKPLRAAKEKLDRTGWQPGYEKFKAFIKTELLPAFDKGDDGELTRIKAFIDRVIQGPHDASHCAAGPSLKPLLQRLKELWNVKSPIFYGSATPEKLHKFLNEVMLEAGSRARQYFWMDFTNFENTHSDDSWDFMEHLYLRAGITSPLFWAAMRAWRRPRGTIGPFRYRARVMNSSGRDDTALANAVLNGFASYLSACAAYLDKPLEQLTLLDVRAMKNLIRLSVCGDDSIGTLPLHSEEWMAGFRQRMAVNIRVFGFETKLNTSTELSDAVYLGMRPYPTQKGWFWGKTIGRSTYKMGWCRYNTPNDDLMARLTGIADMHVLCSSHVPILSDLARKIVELRDGAKRTPVRLDENKPWEWTQQSGVEYDDLTLQYVAETYSQRSKPGNPVACEKVVTVQDLRDLIQQIQNIQRLPCVLDSWLWRHMIHCDEL